MKKPDGAFAVPKTAMVLAAGFGKRMRPYTEHTPKPLIKVAGRSLLDRILDHLAFAGVERAVVNIHHLAPVIEEHLRARVENDASGPEIIFSPEPDILETGGGVRNALAQLGSDPFFVINGDVCWLDGLRPALHRLAERWSKIEADALLLLQATASAIGYDGWQGDFFMSPAGRLRRRGEREVAPFLFGGIQILSPSLFSNCPEGPFSLNRIYDRAEEAERLWGLRHDGEWFHVGTPRALDEVEAVFHHLSLSSDTR